MMRLVSLRLCGIRSYEDETIEFPQGIVVLAGDIGSGKSTILQAVEFALFGVIRGDLEGSSLLRHGAKHGSVALTVDIDGKSVMVERTLRRAKDRIEQDAGAITIDGAREPLSAAEIKTRTLDLLGYPAHLVSKHKGLLYRYTVYTPQEEMKAIVRASKDERLDILRHVFGIDRYQRIQENAQAYARSLRERLRRLEGEISDLPLAQAELRSLAEVELRIAENEAAARAALGSCSAKVAAAKAAVAATDARRREHEELRLAERTLQVRLAGAAQALARQQADLKRVDEQLRDLGPPSGAPLDMDAQLRERLEEAAVLERSVRELTGAAGQTKAAIIAARSDAMRVGALSECPTCRQGVPDAHKVSIARDAEMRVRSIEQDAAARHAALEGAMARLECVRRETDELRQIERVAAAQRERERQRAALERHRGVLAEESARVQAESIALRDEMQEMEGRCGQLAGAAAEAVQARAALDEALLLERKAAVAHSALAAEARQLAVRIVSCRERVSRKEAAKAALERLQDLQGWVAERFVPLVGAMESGALSRIYDAFSGLFAEWFGMLVDDASMAARLDESFSPIVQQQGYDVEFEHLSGGERTACALAYRLALTKAVNELVSGVRTKGILVLDEPTDGFSAEQLDRMREVLQRLGLPQIIIVTHEALLKGMADRALQVLKRDGVSRVLAATA